MGSNECSDRPIYVEKAAAVIDYYRWKLTPKTLPLGQVRSADWPLIDSYVENLAGRLGPSVRSNPLRLLYDSSRDAFTPLSFADAYELEARLKKDENTAEVEYVWTEKDLQADLARLINSAFLPDHTSFVFHGEMAGALAACWGQEHYCRGSGVFIDDQILSEVFMQLRQAAALPSTSKDLVAHYLTLGQTGSVELLARVATTRNWSHPENNPSQFGSLSFGTAVDIADALPQEPQWQIFLAELLQNRKVTRADVNAVAKYVQKRIHEGCAFEQVREMTISNLTSIISSCEDDDLAIVVQAAQFAASEGRFDDPVFAKIYHRFYPSIFRYIYRRTGDVNLSEDLSAQIFLQAFKGLADFRENYRNSFPAWIYTIAHNLLVDYYRRFSKGDQMSVDQGGSDGNPNPEIAERILTVAENNADGLRNVDSVDSALFANKVLTPALDMLTDDEREVLFLKFQMDLMNSQAAQYLGITTGAFKARLNRAITKLRIIITTE